METTLPVLTYAEAKDTFTTLHLLTQIIGKIKLAKMPWINHSWHVALSVTPSGLTTSSIACDEGCFQVDLDFVKHKFVITKYNNQSCGFELKPMAVAEFYEQVMTCFSKLKIAIKINPMPSEIPGAIPFNEDHVHTAYNYGYVEMLHQVLLFSTKVFTEFRARYIGKNSPVHFFWGGFDLAVSRFSGRRAPQHPGGVPHLPNWVAREAYSHEVSSSGFWTGNEMLPYPAFYSYIYPEPAGYIDAKVNPTQAFYHKELHEFILPYEAVQQSADPERTLLDFLQTTYQAGANLAKWNRSELEKDILAHTIG